MSIDIGFAGQTPSLPGGGATVSGLGETFTPDLATGTGTFAVPLDVPHGPNDIGPQLTLRYDTGSPNGPFGLGWTLPLPRLLRSTSHGRPRFDDHDTIVLEGSGPLVRGAGAALRPEVDTGEWRVEPSGDGFLATDRAGTRYQLGTTADSRIDGPGGVPFAWLLHRIEDNLGETATVSWRAEASQRYPDVIAYGDYELRFGWEDRPDPIRWTAGGMLVRTTLRCRRIGLHLVGADPSLVRRWDLGYQVADPGGQSLLHAITLTGVGHDGTELGAPPLTMAYSTAGAARVVRVPAIDEAAGPPAIDGRGRVELVDWYGDGLADVVEVGRDGAGRVWRNEGGRWARPRRTAELPQLAGTSAAVGLVDLDGDGLADLVRVDEPAIGFQPRTAEGVGRPERWREGPSVAFGSPSSRLADLDGDGLVDLAWTSGSSLLLAARDEDGSWSGHPTVVPESLDGPPTRLDDPHVFVADMSGDGSPDLVRVDGGAVRWWPHLGGGRFGDAVTMGAAPVLPFDLDARRLHVVDVDGDGCADVVLVDDGAVTWWPNSGGDHFGPARTAEHLPTGAMDDVRLADVLGTGTPALCFATTTPAGWPRWFALDLLGGRRPGLLTTIDNGVGLRTGIAYGTSAAEAARDRHAGEAWTSRLPVVLSVVSSITVTDQASGRSEVTSYRYHEGRFDTVLRELAGFGVVDQDQVGDDDVPTLRITRRFHTGTRPDGTEPDTAAERRRLRSVRGRLVAEERATPDGHVFDRIRHDWEVHDGDDPAVVVPRLRRTTNETVEGATDPVARIETETVAWDVDGNATEGIERAYEGSDPDPVRTLWTRTSYAADPTGRFRQRVCRVRQHDGDGAVLADTVTTYDDLPVGEVGAEGLVTARAALALTDDLVDEVYGADLPDLAALGYRRRAEASGWWIDQARYGRTADAAGVHGTVTGPLGNVTRLDLDASRSYPVRVETGAGNELVATYDQRLCRPVALTDATGATTRSTYDPLARLVAQHEPGDPATEPSVGVTYGTGIVPIEVRTRRRSGGGEAPLDDRVVLDGAGRVLERLATDDAGEVSEVATVYGPRGLPVRVHVADGHAGGGYTIPPVGRPHVAMRYDAGGRVVRTVRPDGAVRTVSYGPGVVEETDEGSSVTRRFHDATGRVVRVAQELDGRTVTVTTAYDAKGAVVEHVAADGSRTAFRADLLGRTVEVRRPEVRQVAVFDAAGNQVETRTGSAHVFRSYDDANRLVEVRHDDAASAPVARCEYHDNGRPAPADAGTHTAGGRLVRVDDEAGSTVYDYDDRGRVARKTMQLAGGPELSLALAYRPDGRIDSVTYPTPAAGPPVVATYRYDRRGRLRAIDGVIDLAVHDLTGRRTETRFANGVVESASYDPGTGWLDGSTVTGPGGVLRDVSITHDAAGNVVALDSPDADLTWTYGYDDWYRLTSATGSAGTTDYAYDDAGNVTSMTETGAFTYGAGAAPATALTGAGADTFTYDDRGNVTTAPWGGHTLDAEGRLRRIDLAGGGHHELTYSHTGTLARRRIVDAAGATTSEVLSPDQLLSVQDGVLVVQLTDGGQVVARHAADGTRQWLHHDHLGSLVLVTDDAGAEVLAIRYGPYGEELARSGPGGGMTGPEGFGAGQAVVPGLVLLGHRWYCPSIGRFLSPDPLVTDMHDPLAWNAYVYARANPTSLVDPTGRSFWKVFGMVVAAIAIIAVIVVVSVFTFGIGTPGAIAIGSVTWGAVFAATMVGVVAGGVIGGIAAARAGGDASDILLGVLVGGAVGGWAAFGAAFAGPAVAGGFGLHGVAGGAVAGGVSGAINGAAMGFAAGFAGGRNGGIEDVMEKVLVGAIVGLAIGAAVGALSGYVASPSQKAPMESPGAASPQGNPAATVPPGAGPSGGPTFSDAPYATNLGDAAKEVGGEFAKYAGKKALETYGPAVASAVAPYAGTVAQTILVDLHAAGASAFWADIKDYVRTHDVKIKPFGGGGEF